MSQQNQKLYVGNLNFDANEDQVRDLFGGYGTVEDVKIVMDRFSGRSRGFAFVRMDSAESAGKAKEALNGQAFQGKALVIDWARAEQKDRPAGGGGFGSRGDRPAGEFRPRREFGGAERGERSDRFDRGPRRDFRGGGDRDRERSSYNRDRGDDFYNR